MRHPLARPLMLGGGGVFAVGLLLFLLGQRWAIGMVFGGFFLLMVGTVVGGQAGEAGDGSSGDGGGGDGGGDGE